MTHELPLAGCAPIPLAHYLKALGILRLVSEQRDPNATGFWKRKAFVLRSACDESELLRFFMQDYEPTPIVVPWSGSDFFKVDQSGISLSGAVAFSKTPTGSQIIEAFLGSHSERLTPYRSVIKSVFQAMKATGILSKKDIEGSGPAQRARKALLLQVLRNKLPEPIVRWIDSAAAIERGAVVFNSLLGSGGGSDGNSHFSDNYMQALWMTLPDFDMQRAKLVLAANGLPFDSAAALRESLFASVETQTRISDFSPVLFDSTRVGGPNSTSGFVAGAASNPWDFILMLEGSFVFAGSVAKKLGAFSQGVARFPFLLEATPVGRGSVADKESGREIWLPLWHQPTSFYEVTEVFAEARIERHGHPASAGIDAFVALAQHSVDRGIEAFQRIGMFRGRIGGDNYFTSVDQGIFYVPRYRNARVDLLADVQSWLERIRRAGAGDAAPQSVLRALRGVERAIHALSLSGTQELCSHLLIRLGGLERALCNSWAWTKASDLSPAPLLRKDWIQQTYDGSSEYRLALALSSLWNLDFNLPIRCQLEPAILSASKMGYHWLDNPSNDVVSQCSDFEGSLNAILARRLVRAEQSGSRRLADRGARVPLADIAAFIERTTDDSLIEDLVWGLSLISWWQVEKDDLPELREGTEFAPSAFYALLKLCFCWDSSSDEVIPLNPAIHRRAMHGDAKTASALAARRLFASGLTPAVQQIDVARPTATRTAAALIFPLKSDQIHILSESVLRNLNHIKHEPTTTKKSATFAHRSEA